MPVVFFWWFFFFKWDKAIRYLKPEHPVNVIVRDSSTSMIDDFFSHSFVLQVPCRENVWPAPVLDRSHSNHSYHLVCQNVSCSLLSGLLECQLFIIVWFDECQLFIIVWFAPMSVVHYFLVCANVSCSLLSGLLKCWFFFETGFTECCSLPSGLHKCQLFFTICLVC